MLKVVLAGVIAVAMCGTAWAGGAAGTESTAAKVSASSNGKDVALKRPEQIALMFLVGIQSLEDDCIRHAGHACSMDELVTGMKTKDGWGIGHLKFDPRTSDPNYTYTVSGGANSWEARAVPKKAGLGGFYFVGDGFGFPDKYYNAKGAATKSSEQLDGYSVEGDSFKKR